MEKRILHPTEDGTPQGGIISPVLANLALDGLQKELKAKYRQRKGRPYHAVNLIRYADDFVISGASRAVLEEEVKPMVASFMAIRGLELSEEKTVITPIEKGFDFLGRNVRKYNGKLLIKPSKRNVADFLGKLKDLVRQNMNTTPGKLAYLLNLRLRGWARFHRHFVSKRAFQYVDHALFIMLWKWAKKRHPKKGHRWIASRYWKRVGGDNWVFFGETIGFEGSPRDVTLYRASSMRIKRHVMIRCKVNPYDPKWRDYLARRAKSHKRSTSESAAATEPYQLE
jgi:RNA-directed DNA polymerase